MDEESDGLVPRTEPPPSTTSNYRGARGRDRGRRVSNYTRNRRADEWRRKRNAPFEAEHEERIKRSLYVTVEEEQPEIKRLISIKKVLM